MTLGIQSIYAAGQVIAASAQHQNWIYLFGIDMPVQLVN